MTEFASVDQRARDYLKSGQQLMASDVIFTEGNQGAADAAQQLNVARTAEHQAFETAEAGLRRQQATALGAGAAVAVLVVALLVLIAPRRKEPGESVETGSLSIAHARHHRWRRFPRRRRERRSRRPAPASPYVTARPAGPVLRAASQLCTDLGRVSDLDELKTLVGQAADLMDASGIVIWISAPRRHLRAAGAVARLPAAGDGAHDEDPALGRQRGRGRVPDRADADRARAPGRVKRRRGGPAAVRRRLHRRALGRNPRRRRVVGKRPGAGRHLRRPAGRAC